MNGEYYGNDLFCLQSRMSEVDTLYSSDTRAEYLIYQVYQLSTKPLKQDNQWTNSIIITRLSGFHCKFFMLQNTKEVHKEHALFNRRYLYG